MHKPKPSNQILARFFLQIFHQICDILQLWCSRAPFSLQAPTRQQESTLKFWERVKKSILPQKSEKREMKPGQPGG